MLRVVFSRELLRRNDLLHLVGLRVFRKNQQRSKQPRNLVDLEEVNEVLKHLIAVLRFVQQEVDHSFDESQQGVQVIIRNVADFNRRVFNMLANETDWLRNAVLVAFVNLLIAVFAKLFVAFQAVVHRLHVHTCLVFLLV